MKRSVPLFIAGVVLTACGGSGFGVTAPTDAVSTTDSVATAPGATDPVITDAPATPELMRFTPASFTDPAAENTTAITVLVPEGWEASGSVQWLPYWERLAFLQTHVADPVSGVTIDWLPIQDFIWFQPPSGFSVPIGGNYQGKAFVAPITDPLQLVNEFWVPNDLAELNGAQVVSTIEQPVVAEAFLTGFGGPGEAHAYKMRFAYTRDGQPWERDVSFAILVSSSPQITSWYVNFAYTAAGPAGSLDANAGVISTVIASRISTPEWEGIYRQCIKLFIQGIQQQMADTVRFGQLLAQYRAESRALQQQVIDERWASQDRQAEINGQILSGTQTYTDPATDMYVELPSTWDTYWVNENGEYIAADDPNFDPNDMNDGTWTQLTPAP
ncbi:MAG: hypothetical protein Q7V57_00560 [Actinomycetota bacterium]|nr:hypothetical protein [Actinomycetota bacterium]